MRSKFALLLLIVSSVLSAQIRMMPIEPIYSTQRSVDRPPSDGSFLLLWNDERSLLWVSGYVYGLEAAASLLRLGVSQSALLRTIAEVEGTTLTTTRRQLSLGYDAPGVRWFLAPFEGVYERKGEQDE
jgi:hypothetical protein